MSCWANLSEEKGAVAAEKRVLKVPTPFAKRMKTEGTKPESVEKKLEAINMALSFPEFEVPGPESNRQMLLAMAPAILGTAQNQRHDCQHKMAKMFQDVFEQEEARLKLCVAEAQAKLDGADAEKAQHVDIAKAAEADLQAKLEEMKNMKLALAKVVASAADAQVNLQQAFGQQATTQDEQKKMTDTKEMYVQAKQDSFDILKDGCEDATDQKQHIAVLKKVLKKLKADPSLLMALSKALVKQPAARGDFDELVIQEITQMFEDQFASLDSKLAECASVAPTHQVAVDEAQDAAAKAKGVQLSHAEAVLGAMEQRKALEASLNEANELVKQHQPRMVELTEAHAIEEAGLQYYQQEVLGACTHLLGWQAEAAAPPAEE